jgi:hypothetical protein
MNTCKMGNTVYVEGNTFWLPEGTCERLAQELSRLYKSRARITLDYGNTDTGESWSEIYDISGRIGRSMGPVKVPLLIARRGSTGGGAISVKSILSIRFANKKDGKGYLYLCNTLRAATAPC